MSLEMPRPSQIPDRMTTEEFWDVIGRLEHQRLEFKQSVSRLDEVIPAFAMTEGGLIILGVADDRTIRGCPLTQGTLDRVMDAAHICGVEVQPREVRVGSKRVTVVAVPEVRARIVTTPDGRLLRRVGSRNQPLVGDALGRFVRERELASAEGDPVPTLDLADLDARAITQALAADGRRPRRGDVLGALVDLDLAAAVGPPADPLVLKAAVVLFARDPRKYLPGAAVRIVRREGSGAGPGPTRERAEFAGPVAQVVDHVLGFVRRHTRTHEAVVGKHREAFAEYPESVLREAVLNALGHRDYGLDGVAVDITIWDDRIEVQSPGPLPGHITVDNMRHERYSRNAKVMRVLRLLRLVEEYGEGVDRMFREMESRLMEPPLFVATPVSVTVTIRNRSLVPVEDQAWLTLLGHLQLSPAERRVLVVARREGGVTPRRLRQLLPDADVEPLLAAATTKGFLVRVGERGGARYVLSDEIVMRAGAEGVEARTRQWQILLDEMRMRGSLSTSEGSEILDEEMAVVRQLLNDLVRANVATSRGRTRARRYFPA